MQSLALRERRFGKMDFMIARFGEMKICYRLPATSSLIHCARVWYLDLATIPSGIQFGYRVSSRGGTAPTRASSRRLNFQRQRRFLNRHVNQRGTYRQCDVDYPDGVVTAGHGEHFAA